MDTHLDVHVDIRKYPFLTNISVEAALHMYGYPCISEDIYTYPYGPSSQMLAAATEGHMFNVIHKNANGLYIMDYTSWISICALTNGYPSLEIPRYLFWGSTWICMDISGEIWIYTIFFTWI
jgi:hypothetical protein